MLTASRSLALHAESGRPLPLVPEMAALYQRGNKPRYGEVTMIAGRSGSQKSGLALWWTRRMNVPVLYFSADMSPTTAGNRLAASVTGDYQEVVEAGMKDPEIKQRYRDALDETHFTFSYGNPITWRAVDEELQAYVELHDSYPDVMCFDNLMDFENAETEYVEQMQVMSSLTELARETGSGVIVMHHASDKTWNAQSDPWKPASRNEIKNGLAEKPALCLSVGLDRTSYAYHIATVKDRNGRDDPTARSYITLRAEPESTRFGPWIY